MNDEILTANRLFSAISNAIYGEFGDKYTIYVETVEQDLNEPCFFIQCIKSSLTRQLGDRFFKENLFCIQFFPEGKLNPVLECHDVSDRLMLCLEYIKLNGCPIRGNRMNYDISNGVLNFFVNFDLFVHKDNDNSGPKMERLDKIKTEVQYG